MTFDYINFDELSAADKLNSLLDKELVDLRDDLNGARVKKYSTKIGSDLTYNYAAKQVNETIINVLQELSDEQNLIAKYKAIYNGEVMNTGESRKVLHHLVRGQLGDDVLEDGKNIGEFYKKQQARYSEFADKIHAGEIKGSTGKKFEKVIQIGIGGSDLGPRAFYLALKNYVKENGGLKMTADFISNVDPDDSNDVLTDIDFETTLFVLVSKSGTTQETLTNETFVKTKMEQCGVDGFDVSKHMVAVTSETSPLAGNDAYLDSFYIDDYIGGRFSVTSAVGGVVLSLAFGPQVFAEVLEGANDVDKASMEIDIRKNGTLLDALIGIWEGNFLEYPVTAILPYSQALSRFPAHLQQLDMESNGKSVNRDGEEIDYVTGPVIMGEPGTNGQHSFYQLLHQGTDVIPLQFIGFKKAQHEFDLEVQGSYSQAKLNANMVAQVVAFAKGKEDDDMNKYFAGNRPASLIHAEQLTPKCLGALLAHYENKVMFQGLMWNINSFDQEGVQLGKVLTKQVLAKGKDLDDALAEFSKIMGV